MKLMKLFVAALFFFQVGVSFSQDDENWMMMEEKEKIDTTKRKVDFNAEKKGEVTIEADSRVPKLIHKLGEEGRDGGYTIPGYRVQIFFDKDKSKTNQEKSKFKIRFGNSIGCYVEYKAPNYRIKVGNFRTEIDAERYKQKILGIFPTAFVIKEKIKLPEISIETEDEN